MAPGTGVLCKVAKALSPLQLGIQRRKYGGRVYIIQKKGMIISSPLYLLNRTMTFLLKKMKRLKFTTGSITLRQIFYKSATDLYI